MSYDCVNDYVSVYLSTQPCNDVVLQHIEAEWRIYASLNWVIIGSDNGLSPVRRQAIICTNVVILLIWPLGKLQWNFNRKILSFSLKKIRLKMSSVKCCSFCLGRNVLSFERWREVWNNPWNAYVVLAKVHFCEGISEMADMTRHAPSFRWLSLFRWIICTSFISLEGLWTLAVAPEDRGFQ